MRTLTSGVSNAAAADNVVLVLLVEADFDSGILRLNNSNQHLVWNGYTWYGMGELGKISSVEENSTLNAAGISLDISGIDPANIATALGANYQGRKLTLYAALLDHAYTIIPSPIIVFLGRIDTMQLLLDSKTASVTLNAESRLADWNRPRIRRFNSEDQSAQFPDDLGLQFVPQMVQKQLVWGQP